MACTLSNNCAKNLSKRTVLLQLIMKNVVKCFFFGTQCTVTSNNMKLVHWPLMGGLLHLVQRGGDWAWPQPTQAPPRCAKCSSPPMSGQCTNHCIAV